MKHLFFILALFLTISCSKEENVCDCYYLGKYEWNQNDRCFDMVLINECEKLTLCTTDVHLYTYCM
jgi:hypothetical protein